MKIFFAQMIFVFFTIQIFGVTIKELPKIKDIPDVYLGEDNLCYSRDSNTPFTGTVARFRNNVKWLEYNVKNGKDNGLCTEWNVYNSRKMCQVMYKDGIKIWQKSWAPSGKEFNGEFKNGLPWDGVFEEEFPWGACFQVDITGNLHGRKYVTFVDGIENGPVWWFGEKSDERLLAEGIYRNGKPWQGRIVIPIPYLHVKTVYLWEIKSFQAGIPEGEVLYYAVEMVLTSETRGRIVYDMVKQKDSGIYKNGERWSGMFVQRFPEKEYIWEKLFYKEGKVVRREYTAVYSGIDDRHAFLSGWLPVKEEKSPDSKSGGKSDNSASNSKEKPADEHQAPDGKK